MNFLPLRATLLFSLVSILGSMQPASAAATPDVQTIVLLRHGEKPEAGLGQLNCQGLNRALALPRVLEAKYGKPDVIFAPDPATQKKDHGTSYDYVRSLATVEPSAIYFGMPVNAAIDFSKTDDLRNALLAPQYRRSLLVVGWEHKIIEELARQIVVEYGGDRASVPHWEDNDFDSIYLLRIVRDGGATKINFSVDQEGLNNRPLTCPAG
ncbi:histidine phosphatase family protein [Collimonas sp. PA-H2]|uniref:histidine phosphatase family protein n=1 Tax=Collimonas sp. PA-H2 TaxID=1881062 RepID=UPI000BFA00CC|nr:histidine phosphatase family protein [Collimonas sp. PA-H2]